MDVRLLGPLEIRVDGQPVALPGAGEGALVALLALQAGRVVPGERLIDALWGEDLPANPANALQLRVSKLRKALAAAGEAGTAVVTRPPGYLLAVAPDAVDALRVPAAIQTARDLAAAGDTVEAVQTYRDTLSAWRGGPLVEFPDAAWAVGEARRLEELRLAATEECLALELDLGRHAEALPELEVLVREHPLRERLHALAMLALYRAGRQAEALDAYRAARAILDEELGLDPSPELQQLEAAILRQDPSLAGPAATPTRPTAGLPQRVASVVGRADEIAELTGLLRSHRLVTVTGPGGTGKTTVAIEAARDAEGTFGDGAVFVSLAGVSTAADVPAAVAAGFGLPPAEALPGESPKARLARQLGHHRALLLLDNCEHVVDEAAAVVQRLLADCPHLTVVATSREALAVHGEVQYALTPLAVPDPGDGPDVLRSASAVSLFVERARAASRHFDPSDDDLATIADLCRQLDGMPLAIELAAARVRALPLTALVARIGDRFRLLTGGPRTAQARHQTLRATVDWSHQLLTDDEQVLFRRLGALRGTWSLEDAGLVCGMAPLDPDQIIDLVSRLVDRSLVTPVEGAARFRMLETIRQFAEERLHEAGEHEGVMARHVDAMLALADAADPHLRGSEQVAWLHRLEERHDDLRAALAFCRTHADVHGEAGLRLAAGLGWFWYVGDHDEGRRHLHGLLDAVPAASPGARGRALQALALVERPSACVVHPSGPCAEAAEASIPLLEAAGDTAGAARSRILQAVEGIRGGPADDAIATLQAALTVVPPDGWDAALAAFVRMEILVRHGATEEGIAEGDRAADAFDRLGDLWGVSAVRAHQGFNLRAIGLLEDALTAYEESLEVARRVGLHNTVQLVAGEAALTSAALGQTDAAVVALAEAEAVARRYGYLGGIAIAHIGHGFLHRIGGNLEQADDRFTLGIEILDEVASLPYLAWATSGRGHVRELLGDLAEATRCHHRVLEIARELQDPWLTALGLEGLAGVAVQDDPMRAAHLLAAAHRLRETHRRPPSPLETLDLDRVVSAARSSLGAEAFATAMADEDVTVDATGSVTVTSGQRQPA